jgi:alpha-galactosidase
VFTKNLLSDIFNFPELRGTTITLHDIDAQRLQTAGMMARWTSERLGAGAKVEEHPRPAGCARRRRLRHSDTGGHIIV